MPSAATTARHPDADDNNEVYGFTCAWHDPISGLNKDIRMLYYTADDSIELVSKRF